MAPKKKKHDEETSQGAPRLWVPPPTSNPWMQIDGGAVRHIRGGASDTARGTMLLKQGHFRMEYKITAAQSTMRGFGMVVGVSDAEALAWRDDPSIANGAKLLSKPFVAWGVCLSSGRLISTPDPKTGRFGGASLGETLAPRRASREPVAGMTIVVEVNLPVHASEQAASVARREFSNALHPLDARRELPLHLRAMASRTIQTPEKRASLAIGVNGGELVDTGGP
jgi:hypothetical protein